MNGNKYKKNDIYINNNYVILWLIGYFSKIKNFSINDIEVILKVN